MVATVTATAMVSVRHRKRTGASATPGDRLRRERPQRSRIDDAIANGRLVVLADHVPFWAPCDCWRHRRRCYPRLCMPDLVVGTIRE